MIVFLCLPPKEDENKWGRNPLLPVLGPTAETIASIYRNGFDIGKTLDQRLIPIYNQL